jgi:hypothetical protein
MMDCFEDNFGFPSVMIADVVEPHSDDFRGCSDGFCLVYCHSIHHFGSVVINNSHLC